MRVPAYPNLAAALGIELPDPDGFTDDELSDIDKQVEELRRDPEALARFLEIE